MYHYDDFDAASLSPAARRAILAIEWRAALAGELTEEQFRPVPSD